LLCQPFFGKIDFLPEVMKAFHVTEFRKPEISDCSLRFSFLVIAWESGKIERSGFSFLQKLLRIVD